MKVMRYLFVFIIFFFSINSVYAEEVYKTDFESLGLKDQQNYDISPEMIEWLKISSPLGEDSELYVIKIIDGWIDNRKAEIENPIRTTFPVYSDDDVSSFYPFDFSEVQRLEFKNEQNVWCSYSASNLSEEECSKIDIEAIYRSNEELIKRYLDYVDTKPYPSGNHPGSYQDVLKINQFLPAYWIEQSRKGQVDKYLDTFIKHYWFWDNAQDLDLNIIEYSLISAFKVRLIEGLKAFLLENKTMMNAEQMPKIKAVFVNKEPWEDIEVFKRHVLNQLQHKWYLVSAYEHQLNDQNGKGYDYKNSRQLALEYYLAMIRLYDKGYNELQSYSSSYWHDIVEEKKSEDNGIGVTFLRSLYSFYPALIRHHKDIEEKRQDDFIVQLESFINP
jgi:hypothetical protein